MEFVLTEATMCVTTVVVSLLGRQDDGIFKNDGKKSVESRGTVLHIDACMLLHRVAKLAMY